jgi:glycosyltransferase involved in cell wall biosynthesis
MQEIKKRRIVIASVLKPVDDTRMFEKMGISLASFYKVDIIGYPSVKSPIHPEIGFHPSSAFHRLSFRRIIAPLTILLKVLPLKPDLLIITTHELLGTAFLSKIFTGSRIIYDVRENYRRNILHTEAFPKILRPVLAAWVTVKEWFARFFVDHYLLAEKGYADELRFPHGSFTILENKFRKPDSLPAKRNSTSGVVNLVFSGTINESTGVFTAILLANKLHQLSPDIRLHIIGYCAQKAVLAEVKKRMADKDFISLTGGDRLVPHREIMSAIQESDFGIVSYPPNPSTINAIPTKLYEYLGNRLPMLLIQHPSWVNIVAKYEGAVPFDPDNLDAPKILAEMRSRRFYTSAPHDIFWEEEKLLSAVANCWN